MSTNDNPQAIEGEFIEDEGRQRLFPAESRPSELYLLPLNEKPFFPAQTLPLIMKEAAWLQTVEALGETPHHMVGLMLVKPDNSDNASREDFHSVGTLVRMHHPARNEGRIQFVAEGLRRFRIVKWISDKPPYRVQVEYPNEPGKPESEAIKAYAMAIINTIKDLVPLNPLYSEELKFFHNRFSPNEPSPLTDFAASLTSSSKPELQEVLEAFSLKRRMEKVPVLLKKELDVARLQSQIRGRMEEKMSEQPARILLARAVEGDPEGARAVQGRQDGRTGNLQGAHCQADAARGCEEAHRRGNGQVLSAGIGFGGTTYLKDRLSKLPLAVLRALREAESRTVRGKAEVALRQSYEEMERRVNERTSELQEANKALLKEIAERKISEKALRESEKRLLISQRIAHVGTWDWVYYY